MPSPEEVPGNSRILLSPFCSKITTDFGSGKGCKSSNLPCIFSTHHIKYTWSSEDCLGPFQPELIPRPSSSPPVFSHFFPPLSCDLCLDLCTHNTPLHSAARILNNTCIYSKQISVFPISQLASLFPFSLLLVINTHSLPATFFQ